MRTPIEMKITVIVICVIISAVTCFHYYVRQHIDQVLTREITQIIPTATGVIVTNIPNNAIIITIEGKN